MRSRTIPASGEPLPMLGLGTKRTFDLSCAQGADRERLREMLAEFVAAGGRLLDTSPMYGCAEELLGSLMTERHLDGRLFLATKVWTEGSESGLAQIEQSFARLKVARLDLLQIHNIVDWRAHLPTLRRLKEAGRVRYIGVSHYSHAAYPALIDLLRSERLDFLQINYSLVEREAERELLPLAQERGLAVIANRPYTEGALFRRLRGRPVPEWATALGCSSWAQLGLKFVLSHPAVTAVLTATADPTHLAENLAATEGEPLTELDRVRVLAAFEQEI